MSDQLFIRILPNPLEPVQVQWGVFRERVILVGPQVCALNELKAALPDFYLRQSMLNVVCLVPTDWVTLLEVEMPNTQAKYLHKALPYALEEQLADEIDTLHFAVLRKPDKNKVKVAVVAKELMQYWMDGLQMQELRPQAFIPDALCVPWEEGSWGLILENHRTLLRTAQYSALAFPGTQMPVFLDAVFDDLFAHSDRESAKQSESREEEEGDNDSHHEALVSNVTLKLMNEKKDVVGTRILDALQREIQAAKVEGSLKVERQHIIDSTFEILCLSVINAQVERQVPNLLQGEYKPQLKSKGYRVKWKLFVAAGVVWFLLQTGLLVTEAARLDAQAQMMKQESIDLYKAFFPDEKRIVNVRKQMKAKMAKMSGGNHSVEFLPLLAQVGQQIYKIDRGSTKTIELKRITYDDKQGALRLDMLVAGFPTVEKLKSNLQSSGIDVIVDAATKDKDKRVRARLRIKGA